MRAYAVVLIHCFDEGDRGTGGRLLKSLQEHIQVTLPNTRASLYLLLSDSPYHACSAILFPSRAPSDVGAGLRAKSRYLSLDVRIVLNGPYCSSYSQFAIVLLKLWPASIFISFCWV
jgi:hypothetical protein